MFTMAQGSAGSRMQAMLVEYGMVAFVLYWAIAITVYSFFYVALGMGFEFEGVTAGLGRYAAAYVALKLTTPVRIAVTLVLCPILARFAPASWRSTFSSQ